MLHLRTLTDERCGLCGPTHLTEFVDAVDRRGKKLHSEEWKRREENKRQLELNEIKYTRRKKLLQTMENNEEAKRKK